MASKRAFVAASVWVSVIRKQIEIIQKIWTASALTRRAMKKGGNHDDSEG
jgi:hypothetical protein